jgi:hypothetical protein
MANDRDRLTIYTADIRTTWIVIGVLFAVLVLFSAAFGLKAYHSTRDLEESLYNALGAALVALPIIAIGMLFVAFSLRPLVYSDKGITRWPSTRFSWGEIESNETESTPDGRSGYRLLLHTVTDAFPVDLAVTGFLLRGQDLARVEAFMAGMGIAKRSAARSASREVAESSKAAGETCDDRTPAGASTCDGSRILLHLGRANRALRQALVGFLLTAAVGVPICLGFAETLVAAGVPESLLFALVLLLLVGSIPAMMLLVWVPQQAFLTEKGISKFLWLSREWNEIEYYEVSKGPSPPISGDSCGWPRLRVYSKRSGFPRTVYYWTGRMPKADRLRIERIMEEKGIPAYPYPGPR